MRAEMLKIQLETETGFKVLDLARTGEFEHWIVPAWEVSFRGRIPVRAIRLEGLPFLPSGLGQADYTVTSLLPDSLLEGFNHVFKGRRVEVIDGYSARAARLRIPCELPSEAPPVARSPHLGVRQDDHPMFRRRPGPELLEG